MLGGWWWSQLPAACRVLSSLLKGVLGEELWMAVGLSASLSPGSACLQWGGLAGGSSWLLRVSRASVRSGFQGCLCYWGLVVLLQGAWWCVRGGVPSGFMAPPGRCRGRYPPGSFRLTSSRAASAPPRLGGLWFPVFENLFRRSPKPSSLAEVVFHSGRRFSGCGLCVRARRPLLHGVCSVSALAGLSLPSPPRPP